MATIDVTGAQLLEALEAATCTTPEAIGAFPQVSGIEFTLNTGVPYVNGTQYANSTYYAPANPGSRVTISTVNGEAFDPAAPTPSPPTTSPPRAATPTACSRPPAAGRMWACPWRTP